MDTVANDNPQFLTPDLWRRPQEGVGTVYTVLRQHEPNMHYQIVTFCGGVHRDGSYTYAILVNDEESEIEPFSVVAEWPVLSMDAAAVDAIGMIVAKGVHYAARSILDPKGERSA